MKTPKNQRAVALRVSRDPTLSQNPASPFIDDDVADILRQALQRLGTAVPLTKPDAWNLGGALKRILREYGHDPAKVPSASVELDLDSIARLDTVLRTIRASRPDLKTSESRARAAVRSAGINLPNGRGRGMWGQDWEELHSSIGYRFVPLKDLAAWSTRRGLSWWALTRSDLDLFERERGAGRGKKGARQRFLAVIAALRAAYEATGVAAPPDWPTPYEGDFRYAIARSDCRTEFLQSLDEAIENISALQWKANNRARPANIESDLLRLTNAYCEAHGAGPETLTSLDCLLSPAAAADAVALIKQRSDAHGLYAYQAACMVCMLAESRKPFDSENFAALCKVRDTFNPARAVDLSRKRSMAILAYVTSENARSLFCLPHAAFAEAIAGPHLDSSLLRTAVAMQLGLVFAMTMDQISSITVTPSYPSLITASRPSIFMPMDGDWIIHLPKTRRAAQRECLIEGKTRMMLGKFLELQPPGSSDGDHFLFGGRGDGSIRATTISRSILELSSNCLPQSFDSHDLPYVAAAALIAVGGVKREQVRLWLGRGFDLTDPFFDYVEDLVTTSESDRLTNSKHS